MKHGKTIKYEDDLYLIELPVQISGFENFIGAWVWFGEKIYIIDPGPASTVPALLDGLSEIGAERPDFILLTHIHLDHAGGVGAIAKYFSDIPIVCHNKAVSHLVSPEKLWNGSVAILKDIALEYGLMTPVPKKRIIEAENFSTKEIKAMATPGHAPHHTSFFTEKYLFGGETCGVFMLIDENTEYLRPATPPLLHYDTMLDSIEKQIDGKNRSFCYGHFGYGKNSDDMLARHFRQLSLWRAIIKEESEKHDGEKLYSSSIARLIAEDNELKGFDKLKESVKKREIFFIKNSINGFVGSLKKQL